MRYKITGLQDLLIPKKALLLSRAAKMSECLCTIHNEIEVRLAIPIKNRDCGQAFNAVKLLVPATTIEWVDTPHNDRELVSLTTF